MSKAWSKGTTYQWARTRLFVLNRDQWVCQLCKLPIDPALRKPDPMSAEVHHLVGRAQSGDDPRYLIATHRQCNNQAGDPTRTSPAMVTRTQWTSMITANLQVTALQLSKSIFSVVLATYRHRRMFFLSPLALGSRP